MFDLRVAFDIAKRQNSRDMIYGVKAMLFSKDSKAFLGRPDYNKPVQEVYRNAFLQYLNVYRNPALLQQCEY